MLARKVDFMEIVRMSPNIHSDKIAVATEDGERFGFLDYFPDNMVSAMRAIVGKDPRPWDVSTPYLAGNIAIYNLDEKPVVWESLTGNTGSEPTSSPSDWKVSELGTYWLQNVRRWLVYKTYAEMLVIQGNEFTQFGLVSPRENESTGVSDSQRGGMINLYKGRASAEQNSALSILKEKRGVFDGVSYDIPGNVPPQNTIGIFAV